MHNCRTQSSETWSTVEERVAYHAQRGHSLKGTKMMGLDDLLHLQTAVYLQELREKV